MRRCRGGRAVVMKLVEVVGGGEKVGKESSKASSILSFFYY